MIPFLVGVRRFQLLPAAPQKYDADSKKLSSIGRCFEPSPLFLSSTRSSLGTFILVAHFTRFSFLAHSLSPHFLSILVVPLFPHITEMLGIIVEKSALS